MKEGARGFAARLERLTGAGVPADLAAQVAGLADLRAGLDLVRIAQNTGAPIDAVARCYFAFGARLGFDWLRRDGIAHPRRRIPGRCAPSPRRSTILTPSRAELVGRAIAAHGASGDPAAEYLAGRGAALARYEALVVELRASAAADLAALTVAGRELRALVAG